MPRKHNPLGKHGVKCGYGGPRPLEEQAILEDWRMKRNIRRPLTSLEIAVALAEAEQKKNLRFSI